MRRRASKCAAAREADEEARRDAAPHAGEAARAPAFLPDFDLEPAVVGAAGGDIDMEGGAGAEAAAQHLHRRRGLDFALERPLERARSDEVIASFCHSG